MNKERVTIINNINMMQSIIMASNKNQLSIDTKMPMIKLLEIQSSLLPAYNLMVKEKNN